LPTRHPRIKWIWPGLLHLCIQIFHLLQCRAKQPLLEFVVVSILNSSSHCGWCVIQSRSCAIQKKNWPNQHWYHFRRLLYSWYSSLEVICTTIQRKRLAQNTTVLEQESTKKRVTLRGIFVVF
jgi:hypothetical protein